MLINYNLTIQALQLDRLAIYHDTDTPKWDLGKEWKDLSSSEWSEVRNYLLQVNVSDF